MRNRRSASEESLYRRCQSSSAGEMNDLVSPPTYARSLSSNESPHFVPLPTPAVKMTDDVVQGPTLVQVDQKVNVLEDAPAQYLDLMVLAQCEGGLWIDILHAHMAANEKRGVKYIPNHVDPITLKCRSGRNRSSLKVKPTDELPPDAVNPPLRSVIHINVVEDAPIVFLDLMVLAHRDGGVWSDALSEYTDSLKAIGLQYVATYLNPVTSRYVSGNNVSSLMLNPPDDPVPESDPSALD
jgi:hypothetical protein